MYATALCFELAFSDYFDGGNSDTRTLKCLLFYHAFISSLSTEYSVVSNLWKETNLGTLEPF